MMIYFLQAQTVSTITESFNASGGVRVDSKGYIYVADFGQTLSNANGTMVYKFLPGDTPVSFATGLQGASGNGFGLNDTLYQSNIAGGSVSKISPDGTVSTFATGIAGPVGIAVKKSTGEVFVASCGASLIRKILPDGTHSIFASSGFFNCPNGLVFDDQENLYTVNFGNGQVFKIDSTGFVSILATLPGGNNGHITFANDQLYVVDRGRNSIYGITLEGDTTLIAGTGERGKTDGPALMATFSLPNGIDASVTGDTLYVNDAVNTIGNSLNPVVVRMIVLKTTSTSVEDELESKVQVHPNFPNPFHNSTAISFELIKGQHISLEIRDINGRKIQTLVDSFLSSGSHEYLFVGADLPSGVYTYQLVGEDFIYNGKMMKIAQD